MKKIKILCDPFFAIGTPIWFFFCGPLYMFMLIWCTIELSPPETLGDIIGFILLWLLGIVVVPILAFKMIPMFCAFVELDEEGIRLNQIFKKSRKTPYNEFPYFQIACYKHIFSNRYFVVITKKALSPFELSHVNRIKSSAECVKINLTRRNCRKLLCVLSGWQKEKLLRVMNGDHIPSVLDIDAYKAKKKRKRKRK